jgi:hypothetical protein
MTSQHFLGIVVGFFLAGSAAALVAVVYAALYIATLSITALLQLIHG